MQGVGFVDEVHPDHAQASADAASQRLAKLPPAELIFQEPVICPEALAIPPAPLQPLATIRDTIRDAIAARMGRERSPETDKRFEPHVSLAYVNTDSSADAVLTALSDVKPEPVRVTLNQVSLITL